MHVEAQQKAVRASARAAADKPTRFAMLVNPSNPMTDALVTSTRRPRRRPSAWQVELFRLRGPVAISTQPLRAWRNNRAGALAGEPGPAVRQPPRPSLLRSAARHAVPTMYPFPRIRRSRRPDELRDQLCRPRTAWPARTTARDPQGRKASRPAGLAATKVRACHQSSNGQNARSRGAADAARHAPTR